MFRPLALVSHHLCPYVQRAAIALTEKRVPFERIHVDLANKPDWFLALSPLGKTPVLKVGETPVFESGAILEYLEETRPNPLHPADPLTRAEHRGWMEFGSAILNDIAGLYNAPHGPAFSAKAEALSTKFARIEAQLLSGPYFAGPSFSLVDAVFGPVFRYFDVFDRIGDFGILREKPKLADWRKALGERPSVRDAVTGDYETRLWRFLEARNAHITRMMQAAA